MNFYVSEVADHRRHRPGIWLGGQWRVMEAPGPAGESGPELQAGGRVPGGRAAGEAGSSLSRAWRTTGP